MSQIVNGTKNHEFRKYRLKPSVKRICFYRTAPHSALNHICEMLPARTRNPGDGPLQENGAGNAEFNNRHKDWDGYDFAYKIVSVYELRKPISLAALRSEFGFKSAPRGLVYLIRSLSACRGVSRSSSLGRRRERRRAKVWLGLDADGGSHAEEGIQHFLAHVRPDTRDVGWFGKWVLESRGQGVLPTSPDNQQWAWQSQRE